MSPSSFCGFWLVFSSPVLINFPSIWIVLESSSSGITHVAGSLRENAWPAYQAPCLDEPPETYSSEGRLGKVNQRGTQDSQEPLLNVLLTVSLCSNLTGDSGVRGY